MVVYGLVRAYMTKQRSIGCLILIFCGLHKQIIMAFALAAKIKAIDNCGHHCNSSSYPFHSAHTLMIRRAVMRCLT